MSTILERELNKHRQKPVTRSELRMKPPYIFRGSASGYCTPHILDKQRYPEETEPPPIKSPFLDMGHKAQEIVTLALRREGYHVYAIEAEGEHIKKGKRTGKKLWTIRGHVDGVIVGNELEEPCLLEVKAVTHKMFVRLSRTTSALGFRKPDLYPHYQDQVQCYMGFPHLKDEKTGMPVGVDEPLNRAIFVYINRDTCDMLGGLQIHSEDTPFKYMPNMVEEADPQSLRRILAKHHSAAKHLRGGSSPRCDSVARWCFHCMEYGMNKGAGQNFTLDRSRATQKKDKKAARDIVNLQRYLLVEERLRKSQKNFNAANRAVLQMFNRRKSESITFDPGDGEPLTIWRRDIEEAIDPIDNHK
jgi:hypothetical protein